MRSASSICARLPTVGHRYCRYRFCHNGRYFTGAAERNARDESWKLTKLSRDSVGGLQIRYADRRFSCRDHFTRPRTQVLTAFAVRQKQNASVDTEELN